MVNRVFCYSKDVAKQNGNRISILPILLTTIIFIIITIAFSAVIVDNIALFVIMMLIFVCLIVYFCIMLGLRLKSRMIGWATSNDGRIFRVMMVNNGQGLYIGGLAAGGLIDKLIDSGSNVGSSVGGTVGFITQFYFMNKSAQYMSHPEIIAKIVEEYSNVTGAEVWEILSVHSVLNKKHLVKVNCDYKILRTRQVLHNKNVNIEKSYNQFDDLVNCINLRKEN